MLRSRAGSAAALLAFAGVAHADIIAFDGLAHGRIIDSATFADAGMLIEATSFRLPTVKPIVFDTQFISTADPDLNGPPWAGGNLPINTVLGGVLIIPESMTDANNDGIVDRPDDEGRRSAGTLAFSFAKPVTSFGLDVVDIEGVVQERTRIDLLSDGVLIGSLDFAELTDPGSRFYDPTIVFGNNTINRVAPVLAADFQAASFNRVIIHVGGSGAFDNLVTTQIPAPAPAALLALAAGAAARRRR
jgi:hypothetical protein